MKRKEVESCTILLCLTGSRLYGIDNPDSDYDYKGICIPPVQYFFGDSHFEQVDSLIVELETAKNNTQLPRTPDRQTIEKEVVLMIKDYLL